MHSTHASNGVCVAGGCHLGGEGQHCRGSEGGGEAVLTDGTNEGRGSMVKGVRRGGRGWQMGVGRGARGKGLMQSRQGGDEGRTDRGGGGKEGVDAVAGAAGWMQQRSSEKKGVLEGICFAH